MNTKLINTTILCVFLTILITCSVFSAPPVNEDEVFNPNKPVTDNSADVLQQFKDARAALLAESNANSNPQTSELKGFITIMDNKAVLNTQDETYVVTNIDSIGTEFINVPLVVQCFSPDSTNNKLDNEIEIVSCEKDSITNPDVYLPH